MLKEALRLWAQEKRTNPKGSTLHRRLILFFVSITFSIILLFAVLLMLLGIDGSDKKAVSGYLKAELTDVSKKMEDESGRISLLGLSLAETVSDSCDVFFKENDISASELNNTPELIEPLLERQIKSLLTVIDNNTCSGVFILLDTSVSGSSETGSSARSGIFIKKTSPVSIQSVGNKNYYLRGPASLARENSIDLLGQWKMEYDISGQEFFTDVMNTARNNPDLPLSRLYYWAGRVTLKGNSEAGFLLCVPLRTKDGTVFGLCGIEVSDRMFKLLFSPTDSTYSNAFSLAAPWTEESFCTSKGLIAGNSYLTGHRMEYDLLPKEPEDSFEFFIGNAEAYGGYTTALRLYPTGSAYETEQWKVAVLLPEEHLEDALAGNSAYLFFIIIGLLLLSLLASYLISRRYLRPVNHAFDTIKNRRYGEKPETRSYTEIDDLFAFLAQKDKEHEAELLSLEQQRQSVENNFEKAQTRLTRITNRKKQEVDPDGYQMFLSHLHTLTPKEREIFNLYLEGKSAKEILAIVNINENTLKYHNRNIYSKLGVSSRKELLLYAALMKEEQM